MCSVGRGAGRNAHSVTHTTTHTSRQQRKWFSLEFIGFFLFILPCRDQGSPSVLTLFGVFVDVIVCVCLSEFFYSLYFPLLFHVPYLAYLAPLLCPVISFRRWEVIRFQFFIIAYSWAIK